MEHTILNEKYQIVDTLYSGDLQSIYVVKDIVSGSLNNLVVNEFKDPDVICSIKDTFTEESSHLLPNFVESFFIDLNYYVVGKICLGTTFENFLSENNLRLTDKMYLTENLLGQLSEMDSLNPIIKYSLCDMSNISVVHKKSVCFNQIFLLTKEDAAVGNSHVMSRVGDLLQAVFANTSMIDEDINKANIPPAIASIISKCKEGQYENVREAYSDFKSSLIYATFMGSTSIDSQIYNSLKRAKKQDGKGGFKKPAAIALALLLTGVGAWAILDKTVFDKSADVQPQKTSSAVAKTQKKGSSTANTDSSVSRPTATQNHKPTVKFSLSKNKVYEGDEVSFTSDVADPDINDGVAFYNWSVFNGETQVLSSSAPNLTYKFEQSGKYLVRLVVTDRNSESSQPYNCVVEVLPKQNIPEGTAQPGGTGKDDRK